MKFFLTLILTMTFLVSFSQATPADHHIDGTWKMSAQAAALGVGPTMGDISWWANSEDDLSTRACYFDDEYVFLPDGTFHNVLQDDTWLEVWQGVEADGCGTPVFPHNGSIEATWSYDAGAGTLTLDGIGAYLGLAKVINDGELTSPDNAPSSITYPVTFNSTNDTMTIDISIGGGYWRFILAKNPGTVAPPLDGMWKMAPMAGALGVGPGMGDISWWSNSADDVITRACYFDDLYYFAEDGAFENILDDVDHGFETWIEPWQGMDPEGCGTPVAPHNGSIAASWSYEANSGSLTLNGVGAYMGLAKVFNGGELSASADAPESITYMVTWNATEDTMTLDIAIADPGWWRFILVRADASGLNDNEYQVMEVYPNPASSVLNIKNHTDLESLHIYSVTGKMVLQTNDIDGTIDISDFATGLYAISALDKNGKKYQTKFIVK
jgi:hypothetical protein